MGPHVYAVMVQASTGCSSFPACSRVETCFAVPQTLEQYCEDHVDSTFARDMGMTRDDVRNVTRRTLPNLWELHPDAVSYP